jgi:hypothetical protein
MLTAPPAATAQTVLLPRADFAFTWSNLITADRRFDWLGALAFDIDVVKYDGGRVRFETEVEGGLGRQRRRYDLNHTNYAFEASASHRLGFDLEAEAIVQHVSRHTVDRENPPAVSWNTWGGRLRYAGERGLRAQAEISWVTQPAFVDYGWIARADARYDRLVSPRLGWFAEGEYEQMSVDADARGRGQICGGRFEGGLRVNGRAAAVELFAGYERRVDAFPTDRFRVRWFTAGFRIVSR